MPFKEIMWNLNKNSCYKKMSLSERIIFDKTWGFGVNGGYPGDKFYIPADAKIGGL